MVAKTVVYSTVSERLAEAVFEKREAALSLGLNLWHCWQ